MGLNSKAFTVDGKTYTAGIENGQVQDIILIDGGVSIDPNTDLFNELSENEAVLDAISVDTTGTTGNVNTTVLADKEILIKSEVRRVPCQLLSGSRPLRTNLLTQLRMQISSWTF